jgi:hypothetical protein
VASRGVPGTGGGARERTGKRTKRSRHFSAWSSHSDCIVRTRSQCDSVIVYGCCCCCCFFFGLRVCMEEAEGGEEATSMNCSRSVPQHDGLSRSVQADSTLMAVFSLWRTLSHGLTTCRRPSAARVLSNLLRDLLLQTSLSLCQTCVVHVIGDPRPGLLSSTYCLLPARFVLLGSRTTLGPKLRIL